MNAPRIRKKEWFFLIAAKREQSCPPGSTGTAIGPTWSCSRCRAAGVPVAFEIAEALDAPLDIFVVRKLGMPAQPEFAIGAIASGGVRVLNEEAVRSYGIPQTEIEALVRKELAELQRRERDYRQGRPLIELHGRTVILVDDGLATGSTMRAAVHAVPRLRPGSHCRRSPGRRPGGVRGARRHHRRDGVRPHAGAVRGGGALVSGFFPDHRRGGARAAAGETDAVHASRSRISGSIETAPGVRRLSQRLSRREAPSSDRRPWRGARESTRR